MKLAWIRKAFPLQQALIALLLTALLSCQNRTATLCTNVTSDHRASPRTQEIYRYLADLSCDRITGVLAGQNAGHGDQISEANNPMGFAQTIGPLEHLDDRPAILGLDYEHDQIYSRKQLVRANQVLIEHSNKGGLVTINWSPLSPWLNDEADLHNNPGQWQQTRTESHPQRPLPIELSQLLQSDTAVGQIWLKKLDRIADALLELQAANVTVLWRPMQEMNGHWFWWGVSDSDNSPAAYIAVWRHMHQYFTEEKGLHNLLWVFSPNKSLHIGLLTYRPALWAYPGDDVVDIVAGTLYNDSLKLPDYDDFAGLNKPLGIAEYGPGLPSDGHFDARLYAHRLLLSYPKVAYWVSWHSYPLGGGKLEKLALKDCTHVEELLRNPKVITRKKIRMATSPGLIKQ